MRNLFEKFKKPILLILGILVLLLIFSQTTLGKRFLLESSIIDAIRNFFLGNPELHACDYKEGMIILIKPVATGVGDGRYEAGDIVEIRDGAELCRIAGDRDPLGTDEKTKLLPLYYPARLTKEQKTELTESEYTSSADERGETRQDMLKRRKSGLDYTQFLSDREILKVRSSKSLNKLPEIDLSYIIKKSPEQRSVVKIPQYLTQIESVKNSLNKLARKIIPLTLAGTGGTKTICPAGQGCNYNDLATWEGTEQGTLSEPAIAQIQGDWSVATDTTAVEISGWDTTAANYIYIYTTLEARHHGKWDNMKYRLVVVESDASTQTISMTNNYFVKIEGIQIWTQNNQEGSEVYSVISNWGDDIGALDFGNNIINCASGTYEYGVSISNPSYTHILKAWNNIIYGCNMTAIASWNSNSDAYIYNNTFYDVNVAMDNGAGSSGWIAKNNIAQICSWCFNGISENSDYNLSDDASAGGTHSKTDTTVNFTDASSSDFHLVESDTGAKDYGTSTASDSNLSFTDDIDGQTRSGSWDIGADEYQATPIYRSVGPGNTTALASSTGQTLTISDSTAIFSSELASNIGVGDVIVYNSAATDTKNTLAFIHARTSNTQYTVKDVGGHTPLSTSGTTTTTTNWQVFRAYIGLYAAVGGQGGTENTGLPDALENFDTWSLGKNLASSTEQWNVACYADAADINHVDLNSWTTTADNYIRIYTPYLPSQVGTSQRHNGKWDDSKFRLDFGGGGGINFAVGNVAHVRIEGLQLDQSQLGSNCAIQFYSNTAVADYRFSDNIVKGVYYTETHGGLHIQGAGASGSKLYIWNNIIYGFSGHNAVDDYNSGYAISLNDSNFTLYIYNNTFYGNDIGLLAFDGAKILKNNLAYNAYKNYYDYYSVGYGAGTTNNLSGPTLTDAPGTNPKNGVTVQFVDEANKDFHLRPGDSNARSGGANLINDSDLAFNSDIDMEFRPETGPWDIGADEVVRTTVINSPRGMETSLSQGLVGYWTFDGQDTNWTSSATGTTADKSGNNNTGTMTNMSRTSSPVPGISGQALFFDGVNDYVNVGDKDAFDGLNKLSFSFWVYIDPIQNDTWAIMISDMGAASGPGSTHGWSFQIDEDLPYNPLVSFRNNSFTGHSHTTDDSLTRGTWHHVAVIYDGTQATDSTKVIYYLDNIQKTLTFQESPPTSLGANDQPLTIGDFSSLAGNNSLNGLIDEVRVYNRALSASEIQDLYRAGAARLKVNTPASALFGNSGLVGYWTFDGQDTNWTSSATGTTADKSGNNNTGTMTDMSRSSSPSPGISGQALNFDGSDDYVVKNNPSGLSTSQGSVSLWFKNTLGDDDGFFSIVGSTEGDYLKIDHYNGGSIHVRIDDGWVTQVDVYSTYGGVQDNNWHHLVITQNGQANGFRIYVDGVNDTATVNSDNGSWTSFMTPANLYIGVDYSVVNNFHGMIDEVRIYSRALSPSEITDLYRLGIRKFQPTQ